MSKILIWTMKNLESYKQREKGHHKQRNEMINEQAKDLRTVVWLKETDKKGDKRVGGQERARRG